MRVSLDSSHLERPEGCRVMTNGSVRVSVFGKTDLGRTREHNEDTFLVADLSTGNASLHPEVRNHDIGPRGSLFIVADGMGGAAAGELASAMAADLIYRHMATAWANDRTATAARFAYRMKEAVELANAQIYGDAREHPEVRRMGSQDWSAGKSSPVWQTSMAIPRRSALHSLIWPTRGAVPITSRWLLRVS